MLTNSLTYIDTCTLTYWFVNVLTNLLILRHINMHVHILTCSLWRTNTLKLTCLHTLYTWNISTHMPKSACINQVIHTFTHIHILRHSPTHMIILNINLLTYSHSFTCKHTCKFTHTPDFPAYYLHTLSHAATLGTLTCSHI